MVKIILLIACIVVSTYISTTRARVCRGRERGKENTTYVITYHIKVDDMVTVCVIRDAEGKFGYVIYVLRISFGS